MMKCIIIDDEPLAIDIIESYIKNIPFLSLRGKYTNSMTGLMHFQKEEIDLIFLDIQMPKISGMQFLNLLQSRAQVIIISAYKEFALEGYEHDVTDYLLKPASFERFLKSVEKAYRLFASKKITNKHIESPNFIFIKSENKIIKIDFDDLLYIEGLKNYILLVTNQRKIISHQNMKAIEDVLPENKFIRVQKSFIINLDKIESIERQRIFIGKNSIPIGEFFSDSFFSRINNMGK